VEKSISQPVNQLVFDAC